MTPQEFGGRLRVKARRAIDGLASRVGLQTPSELLFVNGRTLRVHHRGTGVDLEAINQCLWQRQYEIPPVRGPLNGAVDRFYAQMLAAGRQPFIIDGGANLGASSLWFASRYPAAHILAVEPAPDNCTLLRTNVAGFDVAVIEAGLGPVRGGSALVDTGYGAWAYRTEPGGAGPAIAMVTLADLLAESDARLVPFILKLDIEGSERGLFAAPQGIPGVPVGGAASAVAGRFPVVILELHDWMLPTEGSARGFLEFHVAAGRDLTQRGENLFSIDYSRLLEPRGAARG